MDALKRSILAVVVAAAGAGCARQESAARGQTQGTMAMPAEAGWGPVVEGLQCRLRPTRRTCPAGESPAFRIDLFNHGPRVFAFLHGEQAPVNRFAIDGRWRPWQAAPATAGKVRALGPGVEFPDLPAMLPADARPLLTPGRHVVQVAFSFEGVEVVSNPVEIQIVGPRQ